MPTPCPRPSPNAHAMLMPVSSPDPCLCHDCTMPMPVLIPISCPCLYFPPAMPVSMYTPGPCLLYDRGHAHVRIFPSPRTPRLFPPRAPLQDPQPCPGCSHAAGVGSRMCACHSSRERRLLPPIHVTCVCLSFSLCVTARGRERARHGEREEEGGSFK